MSTPGELRQLSLLARPDVALFTVVRPAHLRVLRRRAGDRRGQGRAAGRPRRRTAWWSPTPTTPRWRASRIASCATAPAATASSGTASASRARRGRRRAALDVAAAAPGGGVGSRFVLAGGRRRSQPVELPLHGLYNVENCLAAAACAWALGVPLPDDRARRRRGVPAGGDARGRRTACAGGGHRDRRHLQLEPGRPRPGARERRPAAGGAALAVLGDMLELGPEAAALPPRGGRAGGAAGLLAGRGGGRAGARAGGGRAGEGRRGGLARRRRRRRGVGGRRARATATWCWSRARAASGSRRSSSGSSLRGPRTERRRTDALLPPLPAARPPPGVQRLPLHHLPGGGGDRHRAAPLAGSSGPGFIRALRRLSVGQNIREVGPQAHQVKAGHADHGRPAHPLRGDRARRCSGPTSTDPYVWLVDAASPLAFGAIGFLDDYLKVHAAQQPGPHGARPSCWLQIVVGRGDGRGAAARCPPSTGFNPTLTFPFFKQQRSDLGLFYIPFVVARARRLVERRQPDRRPGRPGDRRHHGRRRHLRRLHLRRRQPRDRQLPAARLRAGGRRGGGLLRRPGRRRPRLPVVQLAPGRGVHGRRRLAVAGRRHRQRGRARQAGAPAGPRRRRSSSSRRSR